MTSARTATIARLVPRLPGPGSGPAHHDVAAVLGVGELSNCDVSDLKVAASSGGVSMVLDVGDVERASDQGRRGLKGCRHANARGWGPWRLVLRPTIPP